MELVGISVVKLIFNFWILIIEILLLICIWIIIERWRSLNKVKFDTKSFSQRIRETLREEGVNRALQFCEAEGHVLARVISNGLANAGLGRDDVYDALEEAQMKERSVLETRVSTLTTIAFIAPLLGLLGTVVGIIQAFGAMASAGGADPTAMLSGIAVALLTTACGIIVAVPAAIFFGIFSGKVDYLANELEIGSKELVLALSESVWKTQPHTPRKRASAS